MFSSSECYANMNCGLKVDTQSPGWFTTITKVLKKIKGVKYSIDGEEGMAYISGRVDPNKILRKLAKAGKHAELCWVEAGNNHNSYDGAYGQHNCVNPYWSGPRPGYTNHFYPQRHPYYGHMPYGYPSWA